MEIVFAGFGGQGVLTSGLIVSEMALEAGKNVTWMPSYGPAMRGGKAYSVVKYSDKTIGGPDIEETDILIAMNKPSLEFTKFLRDDGLLLINSDAVDINDVEDAKFEIESVPCVTLAQNVNNLKAANIVTIGALIKAKELFDFDMAKKVLKEMFEKKGKGQYVSANEAALIEGYEYK